MDFKYYLINLAINTKMTKKPQKSLNCSKNLKNPIHQFYHLLKNKKSHQLNNIILHSNQMKLHVNYNKTYLNLVQPINKSNNLKITTNQQLLSKNLNMIGQIFNKDAKPSSINIQSAKIASNLWKVYHLNKIMLH